MSNGFEFGSEFGSEFGQGAGTEQVVSVVERNEIWSDVDNDMRFDRKGDVKLLINEEAIANSIENILLTRVGERVMNPEFGSYLWRYLFDPVSQDNGYKIGLEAYRAVKRWERRVEVDRVDVEVNRKLNGYKLVIKCKVKGFNKGFDVVRILVAD